MNEHASGRKILHGRSDRSHSQGQKLIICGFQVRAARSTVLERGNTRELQWPLFGYWVNHDCVQLS